MNAQLIEIENLAALRYAKRPISKNNFTKIALKNRKNRLARPFKFRFLAAKFKEFKQLNFNLRQRHLR